MVFRGIIVLVSALVLAAPSIGQEIAIENQQRLSSCISHPQIRAQACLRGKSCMPGNGCGGYPCSGPEIDREPEIVDWSPPEYTQQAIDAKYSGTVVVGLVPQADGSGRDFRVISSLGLGLDEKAIEAAKKFKFSSASIDGRAVEVVAAITISFCLPTD